MIFLRILILAVLLSLLSGIAAAQASSGIKAVLRDINGDPIAGAKVTCSGTSDPASLTDSSGAVTIEINLCPSHVVEINAAGFSAEKVRIDGSEESPVTIVLRPTMATAVVNVTGTASSLSETAASTVSFDRRSLDTFGAQTLDDRLRQVPGFTLFRRSGSSVANPTSQGVSLRGTGASGASRALVLKDRIPLNDPLGGWVYWGRVPAESIAEVEVLRGAASDLYGNAAVGGVIAVSTLERRTSPLGSIDLSYGSHNMPSVSGYAGGGTGSFLGSLAAELFRTDGFIPVEPGQRGPVDSNADVKRASYVPTLEWRPKKGSRIVAAGDYYHEVRQNGTPLQNNDTLIRGVSAGVDHGFGTIGSLTARAYFSEQLYHQSFSAISADRQTESLNRLQSVPSQAVGINAQWTSLLGRSFIVAGVDYRHIRGRSDETAIAQWLPTAVSSSGGRERSGGLFAGAVINAIPRLIFSAWIRGDIWHESGGYSVSRQLSSGVTQTSIFRPRTQNAVSPRVSVLFRASGNLSLTTTYGTSFRQPTLNELYRSFRVGNVLTAANAALDAERGRNFEAAVIINGLEQRFYARLGGYCTTIDDAISNVTISSTPTLITRMRQSVGTTRTCGFEADADLRPMAGLSLGINYLYADARVLDQPGNGPLGGLRIPQVPRNQIAARATYIKERWGTASVQIRASGPQFEDDQNLLPLAGYVNVDAFISHPLSSRLTIYAAAENLTNARIESGRTPVITLAGDRSFRLGIRWRFGNR